MFSLAQLHQLQDEAEGPFADFDEAHAASAKVHDCIEAAVDHVPRNLDEAIRSFELAADLGVPVERIADLTKREGRTLEALIELRRLARWADGLEDACVPPVRWQARVVASLIGWMGRPEAVR